jgi:DNA polymerase-3 subunit epsilon
VQRSFDDLGTPLREVTFCVIDLETTGGSPADCAITEIGAVKLRGGECLGTFQTLVDPGCTIPPTITVLTGITDAMVCRAPRIDVVLPSLLEFIGGSVIVGHNVRFDVSFLQAALERHGRPPLQQQRVDTASLARRLLADEVPNCRLGTLADRLRLPHRPCHRALDDALATGDLLHVLIERASALGVTGLDDLMALPTMAGHRQAPKLRLTEDLPRAPGVYVFRGHAGEVLYIGKATNLRSRVRSYFSTDTRRKPATPAPPRPPTSSSPRRSATPGSPPCAPSATTGRSTSVRSRRPPSPSASSRRSRPWCRCVGARIARVAPVATPPAPQPSSASPPARAPAASTRPPTPVWSSRSTRG